MTTSRYSYIYTSTSIFENKKNNIGPELEKKLGFKSIVKVWKNIIHEGQKTDTTKKIRFGKELNERSYSYPYLFYEIVRVVAM